MPSMADGNVGPALPVRAIGEHAVDAAVLRLFFTVAVVGGVVVALLVGLLLDRVTPAWRVPMLALPVVVAAAIPAGMALARSGRVRTGVTLVLLIGYAAITLTAATTGLGLDSTMLAFYSPLIIVAGVILGIGGALGLGLLCLLSLLAMPLLLHAAPARTAPPDAMQLFMAVAVVAMSTMIGALMSLALVRSLRATARQEHRFRQLLAIAADWYWEQDAQLRFTSIVDTTSPVSDAVAPALIGKHRWDAPELDLTPEQWAAHKADLAARRPIRNFVMHVGDQYASISGEPLVDGRGNFRGYWGIGRIITAEVDARRRIEDSEALYRELFERASTAFVIHRAGRVLRANPAAVELLGFSGHSDGPVGRGVVDFVEPESSTLLRERMARVEGGPIGQAVPAIDLPLRRRDGSRVDALTSMVRIALADGPANLSVLIDMTLRKEAERLLSLAKERAEAASRTKSRFLANMSHEIRTPLNGVYGLVQLALRDGLSEARRLDHLRQIRASAEHLSSLLSDVLDLSKIEAGELVIESLSFDLPELLESLAGSYRELMRDKGLPLVLDLAPDLPQWVRGDPTRTRQVLGNYLSNAAKFTAQGRVTLGARVAAAGRVRLHVVDSGIGIDAATRERLFMPFSQADNSTTRRFGGTGLGLSICRELASLMGGEVGVVSSPGYGSTFWLELPLPPVDAPAPGQVGRDVSLRGVRVLVAEDNPVNITIAVAMLGGSGAVVTPAANGREAVNLFDAEDGRFDAVLMDLHMPAMDGLQASVELRKRRGPDQLPIIAMTAAVLAEDREAALRAGMNDFVAKPFALPDLLATVARWTVQRQR